MCPKTCGQDERMQLAHTHIHLAAADGQAPRQRCCAPERVRECPNAIFCACILPTTTALCRLLVHSGSASAYNCMRCRRRRRRTANTFGGRDVASCVRKVYCKPDETRFIPVSLRKARVVVVACVRVHFGLNVRFSCCTHERDRCCCCCSASGAMYVHAVRVCVYFVNGVFVLSIANLRQPYVSF